MGTRSVIARLTPTGELEGRYVHWDGYPEHMMKTLHEFIRRDGYEHSCKVLIDEHDGWSFLHPWQGPDDETNGDHISILEHWGGFYTDTPDEPFITTFSDARHAGAEYTYVIVADDNKPVEIRCYDNYDTTTSVQPVSVLQVLCDHDYDSYCANCGVDA